MAAPTIGLSTLADSNDTALIRISIPAGGDTDVSATKVADVSALTTAFTGTYLNIKRVWWGLDGFAVNLLFDADTDDVGITLPRGSGFFDFSMLSHGVPNPKSTGFTGDIMLTTNGIPAADDESDDYVGFVLLEVAKR